MLKRGFGGNSELYQLLEEFGDLGHRRDFQREFIQFVRKCCPALLALPPALLHVVNSSRVS